MQIQTLSLNEASKKWSDITQEINNIRSQIDKLDNMKMQSQSQQKAIKGKINETRKQLKSLLLKSKRLQNLITKGRIKTKEGEVLIR
jgi:chromosome segregation ATPase